MGMKYTILYEKSVLNADIPLLGNYEKNIIKKAIENKLTEHPEVFGKPLRRSLKGYRKLRVENFRVVFRIEDIYVKIFAIQHRSVVYKSFQKRL
jgi:mRNA interferase RelE/StbE